MQWTSILRLSVVPPHTLCLPLRGSVHSVNKPSNFTRPLPDQNSSGVPSSDRHMLHIHKLAAGFGAGHAVARGWTIDGVLLILRDHQQ